MGDFSAFLTPALGTAGLLTLAVALILRGSLVPRSVLDMMRADKDREVDTWKAVAERSEELVRVQQGQITMLLEGNRAAQRVIEALPEAARMSREGGNRALDPAQDGQD